MTDIFISYSHEDRARAKLFADAFAEAGLNVWWDAALRSGEAFDEVIEAALRAAKAVVVLWSPRSAASRWVRAEATIADRCKTLVPVTIEPCERPIMFELTQTAELSHWSGDVADKAWLAFMDDVRRMAAKAVPPIPQTPEKSAEPPTVEETLKPGQSGAAPSLAVLPFTNRSGLPEDEAFAEGMVEDIVWALSQGVNVRVLGATATANFSRAVITDFAALGRQLGVRYLLEGNVRRAGNSLRVTTQLLEAETGAVRSAARFDRPLAELADLQEELVTEIAASLDAQVYNQEIERALKKPDDITAWEAVARSFSALRNHDAANLERAIAETTRAISIAPDYAPGHAVLAMALAAFYVGFGRDDAAEVRRIRHIAERAVSLAPEDVFVLSHAGSALSHIGDPEEGHRYTERAVRKAPGIGLTHMFHANTCALLNRLEEALSHARTAERLMQGAPMLWWIYLWQARIVAQLQRWPEAVIAIDASLSLHPTMPHGQVMKAYICHQLGDQAVGRDHIRMAIRLGTDSVQAERLWRRLYPNSPKREADVAIIRALYAAAETTP